MTFPLWPSPFRGNETRLRAEFLSLIKAVLPRSLDGAKGGDIAPSSPLEFAGAGLWAYLWDLTLSALWTLGGDAQDLWRVKRQALTTGNVTLRTSDLSLFDVLLLDATGETAIREATLGVTAETMMGEIVWVVLDPSGTFTTRLNSQGGGGNPFLTFGNGPGVNPEWALCMFDDTITGTNPEGEWVLIAHGDV